MSCQSVAHLPVRQTLQHPGGKIPPPAIRPSCRKRGMTDRPSQMHRLGDALILNRPMHALLLQSVHRTSRGQQRQRGYSSTLHRPETHRLDHRDIPGLIRPLSTLKASLSQDCRGFTPLGSRWELMCRHPKRPLKRRCNTSPPNNKLDSVRRRFRAHSRLSIDRWRRRLASRQRRSMLARV